MIKIKRTGSFVYDLEELILNNDTLEKDIRAKIKLFQRNPHDTRFRNHSLKKRLLGKYAFSITSDIRIVYEKVGENTVRFLAIGTHQRVYKK